jgi:hypothetical protein
MLAGTAARVLLRLSESKTNNNRASRLRLMLARFWASTASGKRGWARARAATMAMASGSLAQLPMI